MSHRFQTRVAPSRIALAFVVSALVSAGSPFVATSSASNAGGADNPVSANHGDCQNHNSGVHNGYICPGDSGGPQVDNTSASVPVALANAGPAGANGVNETNGTNGTSGGNGASGQVPGTPAQGSQNTLTCGVTRVSGKNGLRISCATSQRSTGKVSVTLKLRGKTVASGSGALRGTSATITLRSKTGFAKGKYTLLASSGGVSLSKTLALH